MRNIDLYTQFVLKQYIGNIHAGALEAAAPTVFMVWLRAWIRSTCYSLIEYYNRTRSR